MVKELYNNNFNVLTFRYTYNRFEKEKFTIPSLTYTLNEIQSLINFAHKNIGVKNIAILGRSIGASLAIAQSSMDTRIKTVVCVAPIIDFKSYGLKQLFTRCAMRSALSCSISYSVPTVLS